MLVLASASPRRLELLRQIGLSPTVEAAAIDERWDGREAPARHAARLARQKAEAVAARHPRATVLGADTVVVLGDRLFGKPRDAADARAMLEALAGRSHHVVTAVHLVPPDGAEWPPSTLTVWTAVVFRAIEPPEVAAYLASGEWRDKAGAYAIQGRAAAFARAVVGSYTNVVGLPLAEVSEELARAGVT